MLLYIFFFLASFLTLSNSSNLDKERILKNFRLWLEEECGVDMSPLSLILKNDRAVLISKENRTNWTFSVSEKCSLNHRNAETSSLEGLLKSFPQKEIHSILFHLISDRANPYSFWKPFIDYLWMDANEVLNPEWITNDDVFEVLNSLDFYDEIARIRLDIEKTWSQLLKHFKSVIYLYSISF